MIRHLICFLALALACGTWAASTAIPFKPNNVIALTGGSNIERTRFNGFLQTHLLAARPELKLRVRNLGWEGDTVFEQWRDTGGEAWRQQRDWKQQLAEIGADVVIAQFGQMESLGGADKLPEFIAAYEKLLNDFAEGGRRLVLVSPMPFEKSTLPLAPDLTRRNGDVKQYAAAIRKLADKLGAPFIDLYSLVDKLPARTGRLTDNGYQLNEHGHRIVADLLAEQLGLVASTGIASEQVRAAVLEMERLWFDTWRPMNWSFLAGDRTHVPFSHDWHDQEKRLFPEEMKEYSPLLQQADENVWRTIAGQPVKPIGVQSPIPEEPPSAKPQSPDEELASFKILPGFKVNLFASEADGVVKPIQMRWDERGRLWVACAVSYPQIKPGEKANDYVLVCEDTDGDGRADKFHNFVEGLFMPSGLELGDGGLYVAQGTELLHFRDTNGDGKADQRRLVLGGFGTADSHQMINCISWGFGGELWFSQGHHIYSRVETPHGIEVLNRAGVWRLRPRTLQLDPFFQMSSAGANCWGVTTDDYGQPFHKSGATIGAYYSTPGLIRSQLPVNGEPLRLFIARAKQVGMDVVGTRHLPSEMQGRFVIGGYYDNTLQQHELTYTNGLLSSRQMPNLIETTNNVFRPVEVNIGPDGAIYTADWYNPIIGHYQASYRHPDRDKAHGRIWRIVHEASPLLKPPTLAGATTDQLLAHLNSQERWVRYQTKRLLFERDTKEVAAALDRWVKQLPPGNAGEYQRLQALGVYEAHETVRPRLVETLLASNDYRVRAYATRAVGHWQSELSNRLKLIERSAKDTHPRVRLEAVVAASYVNEPTAVTIASRVLNQAMDPYLEHALTKCVNVLRPVWEPALRAGKLRFESPAQLVHVLKLEPIDGASKLLRDLLAKSSQNAIQQNAILVGLAGIGDADDLQFVFERAQNDATLLTALATESQGRKVTPNDVTLTRLGTLLRSNHDDMRTAALQLAGAWRARSLVAPVEELARDGKASLPVRSEALKALALLKGKPAVGYLSSLATNAPVQPVALAALDALTLADIRAAAEATVVRLTNSKNVTEAAAWLRPVLGRAQGVNSLAGVVKAKPLSPEAAARTLAALGSLGRGEGNLFQPLNEQAGFTGATLAYDAPTVGAIAAAVSTGNATEGRKLYEMLGCINCHAINGEGGKTGPDLSALGRGLPLDSIITEVLWPQLNVKEGFSATRAQTRDGRIVEGLLESETAESVAIRDLLSGEIAKLRRAEITKLQTGGSPMPEGLTSSLSREQIANLIRYLADLGKN